jgi:colanic acid biosynthesis glycosyl transferase WcaI
MLASGKVIIATANPATEIGDVISRVGVRVPYDDIGALCDAVLDLANSRSKRLRLGEKGRAYVCENWSKDLVLPRFRRDIHDLLIEAILKSKVEWITHDGS